jgi:hypothetical protein
MSFHPFSICDDSSRFEFIVCGERFKVGFLSASLLSSKAVSLILNENIFEMRIECPSHFEKQKVFETFCFIIQMLIGIPFELSKSNIFESLFIFRQLENNYFIDKCIEFLSNLKFDNPFEKLIEFQNSQIPIPSTLIETISSQFYSLSEENIQKINPSILSQLLKCSCLKIENEDSLFEILLKYLKEHPNNFIIFEFIQFSSLSLNNLNIFFKIFPLSMISSNLWNSLSNLSTKPEIKNRYSGKLLKFSCRKLFQYSNKRLNFES